MKKILALVTVLALVAALIVPMAVSATTPTPAGSPVGGGTVTVNGAMVAPSVGVTAPGPINFGPFKDGYNPSSTTWSWSTSTWGYVTLTDGSDAAATYTLSTAPDNTNGNYSAGEMYCSGIGYLSNTLQVTFGDSANSPIGTAGNMPTGATYTGSSLSQFSLGANQLITSTDAQKGAGNYVYYIQIVAQANY